MRSARPDFDVEYHDEKKHGFNDKTADDEWLALVGQSGWIALSHDKKFHEDGVATKAIEQHRTAVFYVDGGQALLWYKLVLIAKAFDRIRLISRTCKPPYIYHVQRSGRVTLFRQWP